jgi:hypothetical protein
MDSREWACQGVSTYSLISSLILQMDSLEHIIIHDSTRKKTHKDTLKHTLLLLLSSNQAYSHLLIIHTSWRRRRKEDDADALHSLVHIRFPYIRWWRPNPRHETHCKRIQWSCLTRWTKRREKKGVCSFESQVSESLKGGTSFYLLSPSFFLYFFKTLFL